MKLSLLLAVLALSLPISLRAQEVKSPDGSIVVALHLASGALSYEVRHQGHVVLEHSPLGLETSIGSFSSDLVAVPSGVTTAQLDERYTLPHSKVRDVHYRANELTARYTNKNGDELAVLFRVSDRDVALAYRISSPTKLRVVVQSERTGFRFPVATTAFITQQAPAGDGWMGTKPSYEEPYQLDVPVGTKSPSGLGFTFPALFRLGSTGWALVSETGVTGNYVGSRLVNPTADGLYSIAFPEKSENAGLGDATVAASLPLLTPWRTITIGATLAPIVETTVATDVVKPLYEPSQRYKAGRATWSWLLWQDDSMNEPDQRTFIDLAATLGYEYILIDAVWDVAIGREKMAKLVADARAKNVDVLLWYNSNGSWNDAPQTPRNCLDSAPARQREMAWLKSIGVKGIKVDFFGGDKQATMKLYEDILTEANAHGLMVVFHGATLPRGWERLYPNFMSSEAITASENLIFTQGFADNEALNSTVFSFVRNPVAAMDYGPVLLNKIFSRDQKQGSIRRTTDAFQLATAVLFQSPLQHFGVTPNNLVEQPAFVVDFLKQVPSVWDETRFVDGYPGKFVVIARRSGERWYLAATNGEKQEKTCSFVFPALAGKSVTLIHDGVGRAAARRQLQVGADGRIELPLASEGGAVLFAK
ncbi:MAG: glycoside hydrolase family 97 catalytic domain-containing protein [Verrucomicrobia bacterium]|nr:glycoside hydrolase family 97 catalytic domain-containing protein [Verrucomicrobiota bacterium]